MVVAWSNIVTSVGAVVGCSVGASVGMVVGSCDCTVRTSRQDWYQTPSGEPLGPYSARICIIRAVVTIIRYLSGRRRGVLGWSLSGHSGWQLRKPQHSSWLN
jgi:hypothetical protein